MITLDVMWHGYSLTVENGGQVGGPYKFVTDTAKKWGISLPTLPKKEGRYELHDGNWRMVSA